MSSFGEQPIADRLEMVENENGPVQRWTGPLFFMKKGTRTKNMRRNVFVLIVLE